MDSAAAITPQTATTFPQLIRAAAAAYGDDLAITLNGDTIPSDAMSFRELDNRSAELARGLLARGVGKGSRIGFISGNGPFFALMFAAIGRIGAVAVPISTLIKQNELVRVLRQSDVSGLIVQRSFLGNDYVDRLCEALPVLREGTSANLRIPRTPYLRWIVATGGELPATLLGLDHLTNAASSVSEELLREAESEVHTTDQLIEIYTSGSMALPKGVKHNHGPAMFRAHFMREIVGIQRGKEYNCFLPMFWVGGLMMSLLPNWEGGATTVCTERTLSSSTMAMGSVLPDEDLKQMANAPKPWWGLGMSETLGPYSYGDEFRAEGYPVCAPMDHWADRYDVRIADENNQPVAEGEIGELQIRGYPVTTGLHKIESSEHFTDDGYYHTGDMCLVDGARVHFIGRGGDMIKTASSNVSPAEVEMEMQALEGIHSAYVVGLPDQERGELVVAAVVPREGVTLDFAQIEAELRRRLSSYKVPRAYVEIAREDVPMLHSNKVS
ncbi:MAG: class I adenylate-forming enzyme family protein, partial [Novosphingobium sp.]